MPLRTESLEQPSLNLTPMIDIVFLLIIFFMVGTRFTEFEQRFEIELPRAVELAPMSSSPDPITINVSRTGRISIGNDLLTAAELLRRLDAARENWSEQSVMIRADGENLYQAIVDVMSICHEAQIHKFSLAFQPVRGSAP